MIKSKPVTKSGLAPYLSYIFPVIGERKAFKQQLTQLLDYLYIHRDYLLSLLTINQFEEKLFLLIEQLIEGRRRNTEKELPVEYVTIEIKTASLVGIIMWWIRKGLHYSSDYISDQIYLMYRGQ